MKIYYSFALVILLIFILPDAFAHGPNGEDRAPAIDFDNKNVTVTAMMSPSDITLDISNAYMRIEFIDEDTDEPFSQVTFAVDVYKAGELLARNNFYAENGTTVIDIRPNSDCDESLLWKCSKYYGSIHSIAGALYTYGQSNPVIDGPIFTSGGLYNVQVSVIGAGSVRSNLLDPLVFQLHLSIAQEQKFFIDVSDDLIKDV